MFYHVYACYAVFAAFAVISVELCVTDMFKLFLLSYVLNLGLSVIATVISVLFAFSALSDFDVSISMK